QAKLSHRATSGRPQWLIAASRSGREGSAQPTLRLSAACRARSSADERVAPAKQVRVAPLGAVPHLAKSRRNRGGCRTPALDEVQARCSRADSRSLALGNPEARSPSIA